MMLGEVPITRRKRNIFFHANFNLGHLLQLAELSEAARVLVMTLKPSKQAP